MAIKSTILHFFAYGIKSTIISCGLKTKITSTLSMRLMHLLVGLHFIPLNPKLPFDYIILTCTWWLLGFAVKVPWLGPCRPILEQIMCI